MAPSQIAVPAFVSTLAICIVFVPMFFLTGVARHLFVPLAEAVSFAMLASYLLSRTLVPTMARYLLRGHEHDAQNLETEAQAHFLARIQLKFEHAFEGLRMRYRGWLSTALGHRAWLAEWRFARGGSFHPPGAVDWPGLFSPHR